MGGGVHCNRQRWRSYGDVAGRGRQPWQITLWLMAGLFLLWQRQAAANGDHLHIGPGGIFFLILGGLIFIGGLGVVLYFLFRGESYDEDNTDEEFDERDEQSRGESESS